VARDHKQIVADWIAEGLKKPGKTNVGLAQALGITQPQIPRIKAGERSLRAEEIPIVEAYLEEPFPYGHIGSGVFTDVKTVHGMAGQMSVLFRVAAGVWMEEEVGTDPIATIPFAQDPAYSPKRRQYAVQVDGDSMNKVLPNGCYAIVVEADGQAPLNGDLVLVKRRHRGMVERTIKRYAATEKGAELRPESTDPKFKPLQVDGDHETVIEIEGFIIGRFERLGR
jgi:SOS-response transcriptional repressor LexA